MICNNVFESILCCNSFYIFSVNGNTFNMISLVRSDCEHFGCSLISFCFVTCFVFCSLFDLVFQFNLSAFTCCCCDCKLCLNISKFCCDFIFLLIYSFLSRCCCQQLSCIHKFLKFYKSCCRIFLVIFCFKNFFCLSNRCCKFCKVCSLQCCKCRCF